MRFINTNNQVEALLQFLEEKLVHDVNYMEESYMENGREFYNLVFKIETITFDDSQNTYFMEVEGIASFMKKLVLREILPTYSTTFQLEQKIQKMTNAEIHEFVSNLEF